MRRLAFDELEDQVSTDEFGSVSAHAFASHELKQKADLRLLDELKEEDTFQPYDRNRVFPQQITSSDDFKYSSDSFSEEEIIDIFKKRSSERSHEEVNKSIRWLQSVWSKADKLGYKKSSGLINSLSYFEVSKGSDIVVEGEDGTSFYILIKGEVNVIKQGIGVVATLPGGTSFGELALTGDNPTRTATVRCSSKIASLLVLLKSDFDYFIRTIHFEEREENLQCLINCALFEDWSRLRLLSLVDSCSRIEYEAKQVIFRQGDDPDAMYFILRGQVSVVKEVKEIKTFRWPSGIQSWEERTIERKRKIHLANLKEGDFFGELAVLQSSKRSASIVAKTSVLLLMLDKNELLHMISQSQEFGSIAKVATSYPSDKEIVHMFQVISEKNRKDSRVKRALYGNHNDRHATFNRETAMNIQPVLDVEAFRLSGLKNVRFESNSPETVQEEDKNVIRGNKLIQDHYNQENEAIRRERLYRMSRKYIRSSRLPSSPQPSTSSLDKGSKLDQNSSTGTHYPLSSFSNGNNTRSMTIVSLPILHDPRTNFGSNSLMRNMLDEGFHSSAFRDIRAAENPKGQAVSAKLPQTLNARRKKGKKESKREAFESTFRRVHSSAKLTFRDIMASDEEEEESH